MPPIAKILLIKNARKLDRCIRHRMTIILAKFRLKWRRIRGPDRCIRAEGAHEGSSLASLHARTLSPQTPPPPRANEREALLLMFFHPFQSTTKIHPRSPIASQISRQFAYPPRHPLKETGVLMTYATLTCLLHSTAQMKISGSSSNGDYSAASAEEPG
jgi:hypothetical protein